MDDNRALRPIELALLLSVCMALLIGAWAGARQDALADDLIRLHVIAHSDSAADQAEKLRVRDAVLRYLTPKLAQAQSVRDAGAILRREQTGIEQAARAATAQNVTVTFAAEHYPTRDYGSFALPAGVYPSLRVIIGSGAGHNWWCVVFPPLCAAERIPSGAAETLSQRDVRLITSDEPDVVIQFRLLEWYDALRAALTGTAG